MKKKQVLSLLLAFGLTFSMVAGCGSSSDEPEDDAVVESGDAAEDDGTADDSAAEDTESDDAAGDDSAAADEDANPMPDGYDETSTAIYNEALGEFYDAYETAKEAESVSERYALMAVAEAKLMESGVMLPTKTRGGQYAITYFAPKSSPTVMWGSDFERYHQRITTEEMIKNSDWDAMKAKWEELKGTGEYEDWAKGYLEDQGYTLKDTYTMIYTSDPATWDVLATSRAADAEAIINTFDGLVEYDVENELQPALAESWDVSDDGLTYTFHIREGLKWVDSQGREVADLQADDFVAGMQHMLDSMGGLEYLVQGVIKNASEYIDGTVTDFSEVGVKAVDEYTLEYTLEEPISYFMTMLSYSVFAPMSRTYYESQGGKFGSEYDSAAADYTYGKDPNSIAYCGPYLVTNATEKNTIVFKANESYWNADGINVKTLTWLFNDGSDTTKSYNDMKSGVLDGATLNSSTMVTAKEDELFDEYAHVTDTESTSFCAFLNVNRQAYANFNDATVGVSPQTEEDGARTNAAMQNEHFRRAICFATDRAAYNAQSTGEDLKMESLRNSYTPGNFVSLPEEVTIDINGTATTYPAGTWYGQIMQDQIDADGIAMKVWDEETSLGDGFDGWYNPENAAAELETAIEELAADGVEISEENPIYIDYPYPSTVEQYNNQANALKQSIEAALGSKVIVNTVDCTDFDGWYYAGYYSDYGYECNFDLYDCSGWGPDYGDPATYLDTFLPDYAGYMVKCIGLF